MFRCLRCWKLVRSRRVLVLIVSSGLLWNCYGHDRVYMFGGLSSGTLRRHSRNDSI